MGYICTITEPTTMLLLDKIKGFNGIDAFNVHMKRLVKAYTDTETHQSAWSYVLTDQVLESYEKIQQIEFGIWAEDEKQIELLEQIGGSLE